MEASRDILLVGAGARGAGRGARGRGECLSSRPGRHDAMAFKFRASIVVVVLALAGCTGDGNHRVEANDEPADNATLSGLEPIVVNASTNTTPPEEARLLPVDFQTGVTETTFGDALVLLLRGDVPNLDAMVSIVYFAEPLDTVVQNGTASGTVLSAFQAPAPARVGGFVTSVPPYGSATAVVFLDDPLPSNEDTAYALDTENGAWYHMTSSSQGLEVVPLMTDILRFYAYVET